MSRNKAWLFTNHSPAEIFSSYRSIDLSQDLIIAVDNGLEQVAKLGLAPDLIVGDLDSVAPELLARYQSCEKLLHPEQKNETDTELALSWCFQNGIASVVICNDLKGRFDHALGIIQNILLAHHQGMEAVIESENQQAFFLQKVTSLKGKEGMLLSLLAWGGKARFEDSEGLAYPLDGLTLYPHLSRGISNRITAPAATLRLVSGEVLALLTK